MEKIGREGAAGRAGPPPHGRRHIDGKLGYTMNYALAQTGTKRREDGQQRMVCTADCHLNVTGKTGVADNLLTRIAVAPSECCGCIEDRSAQQRSRPRFTWSPLSSNTLKVFD